MIVEEMFNRGSLEAVAEIFAADFVDRVTNRLPARKMVRKDLPNL